MKRSDGKQILVQSMSGYAFGGEKAVLIEARLAYIAKHGARFLFHNEPPPAPGYPRARRRAMDL